MTGFAGCLSREPVHPVLPFCVILQVLVCNICKGIYTFLANTTINSRWRHCFSVLFGVVGRNQISSMTFSWVVENTQPSSEDIFYGGQLLKQPFILKNYKAHSSCSKRQNICYTRAWGRVFTFLLLMPHIHFCVGLSATASWTAGSLYMCCQSHENEKAVYAHTCKL